MSLSIKFLTPPVGEDGREGYDYKGSVVCSMSDDYIYDVKLVREEGSISTFQFTTIAKKLYGQDSQDHSVLSVFLPGRTIVRVYDNESCIFCGRIYSVGRGSSSAGTISVVCEDLLGFLRESFIWYSKKDDKSDDAEYRAKAGDDVQQLLQALIENHNKYMQLSYNVEVFDTYSRGHTICLINSISGAAGEVLTSDLSLDGSSTLDALNDIFDDIGYEYDLKDLSDGHINIIAAPILESTASGGTIQTGQNLKSLSLEESVRDMFSAIMPLGGYGYNGRRLSLSNNDFSGGMSGHYPSNTIDDLMHSNTTDGERKVIYAVNTDLYKKYGLRIKTVIYDDIVCNSRKDSKMAEARQQLVDCAKVDAEELNTGIVNWTVKAMDLHKIGIGPAFNLYARYNIVDTVNNLTITDVRLIKLEQNFDDPSSSTYSFELPTGLE